MAPLQVLLQGDTYYYNKFFANLMRLWSILSYIYIYIYLAGAILSQIEPMTPQLLALSIVMYSSWCNFTKTLLDIIMFITALIHFVYNFDPILLIIVN